MNSSSRLKCRICHADGEHKIYSAKEMLFGMRNAFDYFECFSCKSLQIVDIPADLSRYYPREYYSFSNSNKSLLADFVIRQRSRFLLSLPSYGGWAFARLKKDLALSGLAAGMPTQSDRILDVGCGAGEMLDRLAAAGFKRLEGVDPFVSSNMNTRHGVPIRKMDLGAIKGEYDFITFQHSLEHVADPETTLRQAQERLVPGGTCVIRIPTSSSRLWEEYRTDWAQLDAPRHIVLPSREGMSILARNAGLSLHDVVDDSTLSSIVFSEQYRRDIPMYSDKSGRLFSRKELSAFRRRSQDLNSAAEGDQAIFILRKPV